MNTGEHKQDQTADERDALAYVRRLTAAQRTALLWVAGSDVPVPVGQARGRGGVHTAVATSLRREGLIVETGSRGHGQSSATITERGARVAALLAPPVAAPVDPADAIEDAGFDPGDPDPDEYPPYIEAEHAASDDPMERYREARRERLAIQAQLRALYEVEDYAKADDLRNYGYADAIEAEADAAAAILDPNGAQE